MPEHLTYLGRCVQLARQAGSSAFPNPLVGALIVHQHTIIGEGFHPYAGGPHAEVVAINSVGDKNLLKASRLYVSLEPCNHYGKTPPCTHLILEHGIPEVIIGCQDPNPKVAGQGIARLRQAGVKVSLAPDPGPFQALNAAFFINQLQQRPFISLKWAQTADGFVAARHNGGSLQQVAITGPHARVFVHRLRARHHAIMVGRRTAQVDNPSLTTRHFYGPSPIRLLLDRQLKLSPQLSMLADGQPTIVLNALKQEQQGALRFLRLSQWTDMAVLMRELYQQVGICSILVEGGTHLLQQLIDQQVYDEVYCFRAPFSLGKGLPAPKLPLGFFNGPAQHLGKDLLLLKKREG
ncbi:MAG: bifunctional diaminohydroxyphosphoribosylaminopyrimidine deaminase/5-amino-6-(5-phosphoribosylamino)uracil reductase RibD [Bacteroidetes bacterium]|nr:MAG: bifunctional diaminohydroxyphosphoribosylaminopyrimidine deaminase/5-amino-6-(5-phosphoribosylamino)uracil reductase RibD [Bacteroidota bacterium]